jgi:hypothetical protein
MRRIEILVLAGSIASNASLAAFDDQGAIEWGARWRTGHRQTDSLERTVFGSPSSLPVEITASNLGDVAIELTRPDQALKLEIETAGGGKTIPGQLTCDDSIKVRRRRDGATVSIEAVRSEAITLSPGDSMTATCHAAQDGDGRFSPGHYRLFLTAAGWEQVGLRRTSWRIEGREPGSPSERRLFHSAARTTHSRRSILNSHESKIQRT